MRSIFFCLTILMCVISCKRDDFSYDQASKPLAFSTDTLMLDTVFSDTRTETYLLKVYNKENKDIVIPRIYLENLESSQFKINVDGTPGFDFKNIPLRSKDSLHIFIEMAPKSSGVPEFIADENLVFNTLGHTQKIKLLSFIEDANYYFSKSGIMEISSDLIWNSSKSKIIYGSLKLINGAKLTIEEGTRVYFHKDANLFIEEGGELIVNGSLNKEVIIRGDRHTEKYDSLPGVWGGIYLNKNTKAQINYANFKGGKTALTLEKDSQLEISNSKIFNFTFSGIHSKGANITGTNLVINNCGTSDLAIENGGTLDFTHCSFAQGVGNGLALYLSNSYQQGTDIYYNPLSADFKNCSFWTKSKNTIQFNQNNFTTFAYNFDNNIIKNENGLDTAASGFSNNIINADPLFSNLNLSKNYLDVQPGSPAIGKGNINYANSVPLDIRGKSRTAAPTIGAYQ